jgi:carbon monoxide dehydrogenase subunit G
VNVHGTYLVHAPRERVFAAICDPETLMAVIPGCREVHRGADGDYQGSVALRLPGAVGTYQTSVRLVDVVAPERSGLEGHIDGAMGSISGRASFVLGEDADGTRIDYQGNAVIQGPLARLDSRFAERFAETLIGQGLKALDTRLQTEVSA